MRIGLLLGYAQPMRELAEEVVRLEAAGLACVTIPESYTFDSVSRLGYLAAATRSVEICSGIISIFSRTPTTIAMTAAGLDYVSEGRFRLGLGASGPQVVEGFHGVPFNAPLARTREVIQICRTVWRRELLNHQGRYYQVPVPAGGGTGDGKPLKLINHPVRDRIPVWIAGIGPKNVELAAEVAEGWEPIFFHPGRAQEVWGEPLARGRARRDPALGDLDVITRTQFAVTDGLGAPAVAAYQDAVRARLALYLGGMGSARLNFYNDLAGRYGYEAEAAVVQEHYLAGRRAEAAAALPQELVDATSLVGELADVVGRVRALAAAGVTTLNLMPLASDPESRLRDVEQLLAAV